MGVTPSSDSVHPAGNKARVLLCSVFGPYARDDEYGGRKINPMELYQNQVTRFQGPFSLRMFHRSWGLMMIQSNISAPCTLLDFPTLERFIQELKQNPYDIIGIGAIIPNIGKVKKMCELIRTHAPKATLVVGGHVASVPELDRRIDADHIVRGEGVRWFRRFLGEPEDSPLQHPRIYSGIGARVMGINLRDKPGDVAATLIPSVGCPIGCNFCATSSMFGGKGRFVNFFESGDQLFEIMTGLEHDLKVNSFFVMDENFLIHRARALRLLQLMEKHNKSWSLYVFSSANVLRSYSIEQLVALGISWVWMGLEGKDSRYAKLNGVDTPGLVRLLQSHGVRVLGSSIIGLEEHTPDNIDEAINFAISHNTEFHQFMLYTPVPGTPLYAEHKAGGTLRDPAGMELADSHGQLRFMHHHPNIPPGMETEFLTRAFKRDFEVNGPSVVRMAGTILQGWHRYKKHPDKRIRTRFEREAIDLPILYPGTLWAAMRWLKSEPHLQQRIHALLRELYAEFGLRSRVAAPVLGRILYHCMQREDRRLKKGWTYEPQTYYEKTNQPVIHPAVKTESLGLQDLARITNIQAQSRV